jgi:hypothetical protein
VRAANALACIERAAHTPRLLLCRDENGFGIFRNSGNRFRFFSIGIVGIGHRNFRSESVQLFTDRFLRLPFWIGIYRIQNSEFTETHGPAQFLKFKFTAHGRPIGASSPACHHNGQAQPHARTASPTHCTCHVACTRRT